MLLRWLRFFDREYNFYRVEAMEFVVYWLSSGAVTALLLYNLVPMAVGRALDFHGILNIMGSAIGLAWLLRSAREHYVAITYRAGFDDKPLSTKMLRGVVLSCIVVGAGAVIAYFRLLEGPMAQLDLT